jgi:hypothetical protein
MKLRNVVRALMTVGASIALCAFAAPAYAAGAAPAANATSTSVQIVCPVNDLCLQLTSGTTVLVPSGQSRSFSPPIQVDLIENNTSLDYCVEVGLIIYTEVGPGESLSGTQTVYGVMPGPACPG